MSIVDAKPVILEIPTLKLEAEVCYVKATELTCIIIVPPSTVTDVLAATARVGEEGVDEKDIYCAIGVVSFEDDV